MTAPSRSSFLDLGIVVRLDGRAEQRVPCPKCDHGPRDDALGVNIETGAFHCFRCQWSGRANMGETRRPRPIERRKDDADRAEQAYGRMRRIWSATAPIDASTQGARAVRAYLASRGLSQVALNPSNYLRAHSALAYYDNGKQVGVYPAMVGMFTDRSANHVTLHLTYLRSDGSGKAEVPAPKKLLPTPYAGATRGGAIRLYRWTANGELGIAEGIETALSLRALQGIPTWAAFSAENIALFDMPKEIRTLYVAVDVDESGVGENAVQRLVASLRGIPTPPRVILVRPEGEGPRDLNDELMQRERARRCLN